MSESFWTIVIKCSILMCVVAGGYLLLTLRIWPRVFLRRYPEDIQKVVGPLTRRERTVGLAASLLLFISLFGFPSAAKHFVTI